MSQKTSRRDLLKRALIVLGAAALVQPSGGVLGFAQETPKKDDLKRPIATAGTTKGKKGRKGKKGGKSGKKAPKTPKKEG